VNLAIAYSNRGGAYIAKGQMNRAIADFNKTIRLNPKSALAYNNRGIAYGIKGQRDRAIADLRRALKLDPSNKNIRDELNSLQRG
jgi:Flp pilus assembly protein TadD